MIAGPPTYFYVGVAILLILVAISVIVEWRRKRIVAVLGPLGERVNKVTLLRAAVWVFASFLIVICLWSLFYMDHINKEVLRTLGQPPGCCCCDGDMCAPVIQKCREAAMATRAALTATPLPTALPWWQFWGHPIPTASP